MDQNSNQSEVNAAFKEEMKESQLDGFFTQERAANVSLASISKLKKENGEYIRFSPGQTDILTVLLHPTSERRMRVIEATLKDAGVELDETTKALLRPLFNPAAVEEKLKQLKNPQKKTLRDFVS